VIFDAPPTAITELNAKFHLETDVFRWQCTEVVPEPVRKPRTGVAAASGRE